MGLTTRTRTSVNYVGFGAFLVISTLVILVITVDINFTGSGGCLVTSTKFLYVQPTL